MSLEGLQGDYRLSGVKEGYEALGFRIKPYLSFILNPSVLPEASVVSG